jgi:hypothetical protein
MKTDYKSRIPIPFWRCIVYGVLLTCVIGFLGLFNRWLLLLIPCGIIFLIALILVLNRQVGKPESNQWIRKNFKWLILVYAIGQLIVLVWKWLEK